MNFPCGMEESHERRITAAGPAIEAGQSRCRWRVQQTLIGLERHRIRSVVRHSRRSPPSQDGRFRGLNPLRSQRSVFAVGRPCEILACAIRVPSRCRRHQFAKTVLAPRGLPELRARGRTARQQPGIRSARRARRRTAPTFAPIFTGIQRPLTDRKIYEFHNFFIC